MCQISRLTFLSHSRHPRAGSYRQLDGYELWECTLPARRHRTARGDAHGRLRGGCTRRGGGHSAASFPRSTISDHLVPRHEMSALGQQMNPMSTREGGLCSTSGRLVSFGRTAARPSRAPQPAWARRDTAARAELSAGEAPPPLTNVVKPLKVDSQPTNGANGAVARQHAPPPRSNEPDMGDLKGLAYRVPGTGESSLAVPGERGGLIPQQVLEDMDTKFIQQVGPRPSQCRELRGVQHSIFAESRTPFSAGCHRELDQNLLAQLCAPYRHPPPPPSVHLPPWARRFGELSSEPHRWRATKRTAEAAMHGAGPEHSILSAGIQRSRQQLVILADWTLKSLLYGLTPTFLFAVSYKLRRPSLSVPRAS